jgi:hypothetical protein
MSIAFIITHDTTTVVLGAKPYSLTSSHPDYPALLEAIKGADWDEVTKIATQSDRLTRILEDIDGDIQVFYGHVVWNGEEVHGYIVERMIDQARQGLPTAPVGRFLKNVAANPSMRAREDLYRWCEAGRMPITEDGMVVAFKIVNDDFTDCYTGTFDNTPGKGPRVPRSQVDDDFRVTCSKGLHVCSAEYLPHFGPSNKRVVQVHVDPADFVAFPEDYKLSKARVCAYKVIRELPKDEAATYFPKDEFVWSGDFTEDDEAYTYDNGRY